jgi:DNA topoisomerase-1
MTTKYKSKTKVTKFVVGKSAEFSKDGATYLIIVESPSKCAKIETYLGANYKCIATKGHFKEIDGLKNIDTKKTFEPTFTIIKEKASHVDHMRKCIKQFAKSHILLATDDDREGEAISWHICQTFDLPVETTPRILFREITKPALLAAVNAPTLVNMRLVHAQHARQVLDMIVGFKVSPLLWKHIYCSKSNSLSAGRCQTPALRLVYDNEKKRDSAGLELFYKNVGYFLSQNIPFELNKEFTDPKDARTFLEKTRNYTAHSLMVEEAKESLRAPPVPFNTSRLLQSANNSFAYSPNTTMQICQRLYQNGHITYMRTDNTKYSGVFLEQLEIMVKKDYGDEYLGNLGIIENKDKANPHEAIRVTHLDVAELTDESDKKDAALYKLIWRNTVESGMAAAKYNVTKAKILAVDGAQFSASFEVPTFLGWKKVAGVAKSKDQEYLATIKTLSKETQKNMPYSKVECLVTVKRGISHYTESTLIKELEDLGIGRPSTFASLVDTIQDRGYVKCMDVPGQTKPCEEFQLFPELGIKSIIIDKVFGQEKNKLVIQPVGVLCLEFLVQHFRTLFDYEYTKEMENQLDVIATSDAAWGDLCRKCYLEIKTLSATIPDKVKPAYPIDENHEIVILQYGPVIKCSDPADLSKTLYKTIRKDIILDLEKAKAGFYKLSDLVAIPKENLGLYNETPVLLKTGKYGAYLECGDFKTSLKEFDIPLDQIVLDDVIHLFGSPDKNGKRTPPAPKNKSILRQLDADLSVRLGKFGPYIYYKTATMTSPQFFNLKKFQQNPCVCDAAVLMEWIKKTYTL